jgi:hypothetical protein
MLGLRPRPGERQLVLLKAGALRLAGDERPVPDDGFAGPKVSTGHPLTASPSGSGISIPRRRKFALPGQAASARPLGESRCRAASGTRRLDVATLDVRQRADFRTRLCAGTRLVTHRNIICPSVGRSIRTWSS